MEVGLFEKWEKGRRQSFPGEVPPDLDWVADEIWRAST